jgi:hypothetical protein
MESVIEQLMLALPSDGHGGRCTVSKRVSHTHAFRSNFVYLDVVIARICGGRATFWMLITRKKVSGAMSHEFS